MSYNQDKRSAVASNAAAERFLSFEFVEERLGGCLGREMRAVGSPFSIVFDAKATFFMLHIIIYI